MFDPTLQLPPSIYDDIVTFWAKISWSCSNTLIGFSSQELGTGQGWEEREPITVIGSFYLLQSHPNTSPGQYPRLIRQESLKRPEARGQLGRGCGNLGGHGQPILLRARIIHRAVYGTSRFFTVPGEDYQVQVLLLVESDFVHIIRIFWRHYAKKWVVKRYVNMKWRHFSAKIITNRRIS